MIAASGLFVLFMAGMGWRYIFGAVVLAGPRLADVDVRAQDYQKQRILTMLDPEATKTRRRLEYHPVQDGDGSGGWEGKGWMLAPSPTGFPAGKPHGFIIAVLSEEFGLRGCWC